MFSPYSNTVTVQTSCIVPPFGNNYTWWANINNATYSNSGGIDYVDTIPLTGIVDQFEQPVAVSRPRFNLTGYSGNATMQATSIGQRIYKVIDTNLFFGNGTFAFLGKMDGPVTGAAQTLFTEATPTASTYNFQLYTDFNINSLQFYTPTDSINIIQSPFPAGVFAVHHLTLSGNTLRHYVNGGIVSTATINQNFGTPYPLTAFGYKGITAEQGLGEMGDIVALNGSALSNVDILNDYNNFWKVKYPLLP